MDIYEEAARHLSEHDLILAPVIAEAGPATMRPHRRYYEALVGSSISQQLSTKAADSIEKRFLALFDDAFPSPEEIPTKDVETLRGVGFSRAKATYVRDLAQHIVDGKVTFDHLDELPNDEVIKELTSVKGIGEWTAHMFLMFCMGRTDILPTGDQGIRSGMRTLYKLNTLPDPKAMQRIAKKYQWHPYESMACWYIWHFLDNKPKLD